MPNRGQRALSAALSALQRQRDDVRFCTEPVDAGEPAGYGRYACAARVERIGRSLLAGADGGCALF